MPKCTVYRCLDCEVVRGELHLANCITRVNEGMSGMEITGGKVTTEVKHLASYADDRIEYFIKLEFDIPGGTACFKLSSSEYQNSAIEAVMILRGKK